MKKKILISTMCILFTMTFPITTGAMENDGELSIFYRVWDEIDYLTGEEIQRGPLAGTLSLRTSQFGVEGLEFVLSGLAGFETGDDVQDYGQDDAQLTAAYLSWHNSSRQVALRGGRFSVFSGLRLTAIDGVSARFTLLKDTVTVDLYGGEWYDMRAGGYDLGDGPAFGGSVTLAGMGPLMIGAGFHQRGEDEEEISRASGKILLYVPGMIRFQADGEYDTENSRFAHGMAELGFILSRNITWIFEAEEYEPDPDAAEDDIYIIFSRDVFRSYGSRLTVGFGGNQQVYFRGSRRIITLESGDEENGTFYEAGYSIDSLNSRGYKFDLSLSSLESYTNRITGAKGCLYARLFVPGLTWKIGFDIASLRDELNGEDLFYSLNGSADYALPHGITVGINVEEASTRDYSNNLRAGLYLKMGF